MEQLQLRASTARSQVDPDTPDSAFVYRRLEEIADRSAELAELLERVSSALNADPAPQPEPEETAPARSNGTSEAVNGMTQSANGAAKPASGNGNGNGPYSFAAKRSDQPAHGASPAAVRLVATQLAEQGLGPADIEERLEAEFGVAEPAALVPDILARAAS